MPTKRWIPRISTIPATGTTGSTIRVLVSMTNAAPVTPAAPFEVSIATRIKTIWLERESSVLVAWAINRIAMVMYRLVPFRLKE
ncbi:hypothetical protein D3C72_2259420 [compost metagenome]